MQLAHDFLPGAGRSLADCCAAYDIDLINAHRASADATATARLLAAYLRSDPMFSDWHEHRVRAQQRRWPVLPALSTLWVKRAPPDAQPVHFLQRISIKLPEHSGPAEHVSYLALLDQCLLDRALSSHEAMALVELAENLGISRDTCARLHRVYLDELTLVAWADGHLTEEEIAELHAVAILLALDPTTVTRAQPRPARPLVPTDTDRLGPINKFQLAPGDPIVLTGEMSRPRDHWQRKLTARGFVVKDGITKRVKLLVAADPDSLSGKARKARDYGIPIVSEEGLIALLKRSDSTAPAPI
jgi:DNA polymerase-3 subunit epsilon